MGRKNKNGRSRPHVNKYINQKGRLLRKQRTARTEKSAQKEALRQDTQQQNSPQQMVQRFEIWFAELGDHFGSSVQSGSRPVLVISNDVANRFSSTLTVIPLTTVQKKLGLPTHIQIAEADCQMINDHAYLRNCRTGRAGHDHRKERPAEQAGQPDLYRQAAGSGAGHCGVL